MANNAIDPFGEDAILSDVEALLDELNIERGSRSKPVELPKRIFVNRALRLDKIGWFGFDLDYTLAIYDEMTYNVFLRRLVKDLGYPESILRLKYDKNFIVRGVVADIELGNLLKLDSFANVVTGYHGRKRIDKLALSKIYPGLRIDTEKFDTRYILLNTSFDIPKASVLGDLIQHFEDNKIEVSPNHILQDGKPIDYKNIWQDINHVTDLAHSREMKTDVLAQLDRFVEGGDSLAETLGRLRASGKRLLLITNSPWYYVNGILQYLLEGKKNSSYSNWREYFDVIVVNASKPDFFIKGKPFRELIPSDGSMMLAKVTKLEKGRIYSYGNLADLERMCSIGAGNDVLYVGDHIFSDVLISKKRHGWRTLLIIPELERDLLKTAKVAPLFAKMASLQALKCSLWDSVDSDDSVTPEMRALKSKFHQVEAAFNSAYNKYFGSIFRSGPHSSFFSMQVSRYADLYTTSISNFRYYHMEHTFVPPIKILAHELDPILGAEEDLEGLVDNDLDDLNEDERNALTGGHRRASFARPSHLKPEQASPLTGRSPRGMEIPLGSPSTPLWYHNASSMQQLSGMPLGRDYGTSPMTDHSHAVSLMQQAHPSSSYGHRHDHLHAPGHRSPRHLDSERKSDPIVQRSIIRDTILESSQEVPKDVAPLDDDYPAPLSLDAPSGPMKIWAQSDQAEIPRKTSGADLSLKKSSNLVSPRGLSNGIFRPLSNSQEKSRIMDVPQSDSTLSSSGRIESPLKSPLNTDPSLISSQEFVPRSPARQIPMVNPMGQPLSESGSIPKRRPSVPLKSTVKIHVDRSDDSTDNDSNDTVFQLDV